MLIAAVKRGYIPDVVPVIELIIDLMLHTIDKSWGPLGARVIRSGPLEADPTATVSP